MESIDQHKESFYAEIEKIKSESRKIYTKEEIQAKIKLISESKNNQSTKLATEYYHLRNFQIFEIGGINRLIRKMNENDHEIYIVVAFEDLFDEIRAVHLNCGHGGVNKMVKICNKKFDNIHQKFLSIDNQFCHGCQLKSCKSGSKKVVVKPIISDYLMNRGQLDLVDFQSMPDWIWKWLMHYQDHHNKLSHLNPLTSKCAREVALRRIDIFTLFGPPYILQMDNGREFVAEVIKELKLIWPKMTIVHGKPRHPQSQGSVERANADVKDMLRLWMRENQSTNWALGLKFVQLQKNTSYHSTIGCTPYFATFRREIKFGLESSLIPKEILLKLTTEEELQQTLQKQNKQTQEKIFENNQVYFLTFLFKRIERLLIGEDENEEYLCPQSPLFENDSILEKRSRLELSDEEEDVLEPQPKIGKFEQNAIKIADILEFKL
ncbi:unnamed protein product [Brachionus calyciflorus]|uniref:Integrase catalytic domain-containing protein n=1 Tax=Brachionus calyciflorus TaxID=104777 RepID=A0A814HXD8_9BILA|nr:unnamed protein product [Brachionus calyciflorus]